jgi:uncharacterized protein involved in type VI secretion and phage assembly
MNNSCFGIYRGIVIDNDDPAGLMRIKVRVPTVLGTSESWAAACAPPGATLLPDIDTEVWIEFERGDPSFPVWMGVIRLP